MMSNRWTTKSSYWSMHTLMDDSWELPPLVITLPWEVGGSGSGRWLIWTISLAGDHLEYGTGHLWQGWVGERILYWKYGSSPQGCHIFGWSSQCPCTYFHDPPWKEKMHYHLIFYYKISIFTRSFQNMCIICYNPPLEIVYFSAILPCLHPTSPPFNIWPVPNILGAVTLSYISCDIFSSNPSKFTLPNTFCPFSTTSESLFDLGSK